MLRGGSLVAGEAGSKAVKSQQPSVARMERKRNAGAAVPDFASLHPGYEPEKNYYGAGIDSRLEMLRPRMS